MDSKHHKKTIIVIGAGFGGAEFCRHFKHDDWKILLLDRQNHHVFQPLLYQVATAGLSATDIAQPIRQIFSERKDITVLMEEVLSIDADNHQVVTQLHRISYDYLVVAAGAKTSYFGKTDWTRLAPGLKTLDDAMRVRREVLYAFERAETCTDPDERKKLLTTVIVGGGPTGVELAGAFAELSRHVFRENFRRMDPSHARIILVESNERLLKTYPEELSAYALHKLQTMKVEVRTGARVTEIGEDYVTVGEERIATLNCIWAAGVEAEAVAATVGVPTDRAGRVLVSPDLSVPGHEEIFVIGDAASLTDAKGIHVPGVAPAAIQMGRYVANLIHDVEDIGIQRSDCEAFVYLDKGSMATIGKNAAVAEAGKVQLCGFGAWLAWLFVHLFMLVGLRNKISVFINWIWAYFAHRHNARLITGLAYRSPRRQQISDKPQPDFHW